MDNFTLIYKILRWLEQSMDCECPDYSELSAERFKVSEPRFLKVMRMLVEARYIKGVEIELLFGGDFDLKYLQPMITLEGLEFLENNTTMQKAYRLLKGIKDVTPGI